MTEVIGDMYTTLLLPPPPLSSLQFLQLQAGYYQVVADLLRSLVDMLKTHEAKVPLEAYVKQLDLLHTQYAAASVNLASYSYYHWPTFKPYGSPSPPLLRPCPTNCHLHKVIVSATPVLRQPTSPAPFDAGEDEEQHNGPSLTSLFGEIEGVYPYITMALPSRAEFNLSISLKKTELIHELRRTEAVTRQRYHDLCNERSVVEQFSKRSSVVSVTSLDEVGPLVGGATRVGGSQVGRAIQRVSAHCTHEVAQTCVVCFVQCFFHLNC